MADITVEKVMFALSDPMRVRIFTEIAKSECSQICSNFISCSSEKKIPKSTLSKHFRILREAGLIYSERKGIEMHNTSRCKELKARFGNMVASIIDAYVAENKRSKSNRHKS